MLGTLSRISPEVVNLFDKPVPRLGLVSHGHWFRYHIPRNDWAFSDFRCVRVRYL